MTGQERSERAAGGDSPDDLADATRERLLAIRRQLRDDEIRNGSRKPRSMRETELWLAGLAERTGRRNVRQPPP